MKILKFGGTSVGSTDAIRTLIHIVKKETDSGQKIGIVCSAMGGVTNKLISLGKQALDKEEFLDDLRAIENRHYEVIRYLLRVENQNRALISIKLLTNEVEELLFGVKALGELSAGVNDKLVAYGELLSNSMIAEVLQQAVGKAIFCDARALLVTNSHFGNAQVLEGPTYEKISAWAAALGDSIPVITGFVAADENGRTTTLGRGGSDYTAALFGVGMNASEIQIWTDVDGFMTADPRLVKKAYSLAELSYEEAMELSYFGAKVIYPPTMIPAISRQIPILIKNTFNPTHEGTRIHSTLKQSKGLIKGIASVADVCLLNIQGTGIIGTRGFSGRLFTAIANAGVNVMLITQASSEHSISIAINPADSQQAVEAIQAAFEYEILKEKIAPPHIVNGLSILAVVGENMRHATGLSGKLFSTLGRSAVNVVAIAQGSSELNISVVISRTDLAKALNAVHDSLFLSPVKTVNVYCVGTGNIGATLIDQLHAASAYLAKEHNLQIAVMGIINSRKMLIGPEGGLLLDNWRQDLDTKGEQADLHRYISEIIRLNLPNSALIDNSSNKKVVEKYAETFRNNISVITCNKIGNSESWEQYTELKLLSRKNAVFYHYETTVGAALPIIKSLNDLLVSGDEIISIEAILSGTISFIFNNYKEGRTFGDVVREAQAKGYTEPDPRDDLNGMDFSRKMLILAREMGLSLEMRDIVIDPILPDNCLKASNIDAFYAELDKSESHFASARNEASKNGKVLRYIGNLRDGKIHVSMQAVGTEHTFYSLDGSDNIIAFNTARYNQGPLVIKGPGAGPQVTAAGVFADIVKVATV